MTIKQFADQLWEYKLLLPYFGAVTDVVIRTEHGDSDIAALHVEGNVLVIDLGKEMPS